MGEKKWITATCNGPQHLISMMSTTVFYESTWAQYVYAICSWTRQIRRNACPIWHNGDADEWGSGEPPAAEAFLFPYLFSAVSNCSDAKVRSIISGQLRHKLILLFRRSAPIIIQTGAITVNTPVSWFPPYINIWLKGVLLLPSLIYPSCFYFLALILCFPPSLNFPLSYLRPSRAIPFHFLLYHFFALPHFRLTSLFSHPHFFFRMPRVAYNWICRECMSKYN